MKRPRPQRMSFPVSRKSALKTVSSVERWARMLDIYYVDDFSIVLGYLVELNLDTTKMAKALEEEDWVELSFQQVQFLIDWQQELIEQIAPIPRCAVYLLSPMERKRFQVRRAEFGDCDRHVVTLSMYELILSCVYRQINKHSLALNDKLVERAMMCHVGWFQWQTDVQRVVIWIRRKEYENMAGWKPFLDWKVERIECPHCRMRFTRLVDRIRSEVESILSYGRPFNEKNYFGKIDAQPEQLKRIELLKSGRGK